MNAVSMLIDSVRTPCTSVPKTPIFVLGFGGNALDLIDTIETGFAISCFVDDDPARHGLFLQSVPVLSRAALADRPAQRVVTAIGSEHTFRQRKAIIGGFGLDEDRFARVVDPFARVSRYARLGRDVIICSGVVIGANAVIGDHVFILPNTIIHHESIIDDYCIVGSGVTVAGCVHVGPECFLGSGCTIKNGIRVGGSSLIGMAANVVRDVPMRSTIVGNPGRLLTRPVEVSSKARLGGTRQ
jgi:sugar O-acyltransferase (sialic acid O-acetyltransferase NeuD family)